MKGLILKKCYQNAIKMQGKCNQNASNLMIVKINKSIEIYL